MLIILIWKTFRQVRKKNWGDDGILDQLAKPVQSIRKNMAIKRTLLSRLLVVRKT